MLTLVSGIVGTTWGLVQAGQALGAAAEQRAAAEKLAHEKTDIGRSRAAIAGPRQSAKRIGSQDAEFSGVRHPVQAGERAWDSGGSQKFAEHCCRRPEAGRQNA